MPEMITKQNYELVFLPLMPIPLKTPQSQNYLWVTIEGEKQAAARYYYDISQENWSAGSLHEGNLLCCYAKEGVIKIEQYEKVIIMLHKIAEALEKRLIVVTHIKTKLPYFSEHFTQNEVIKDYVGRYGSYMIYQEENTVPWVLEVKERRMHKYRSNTEGGIFFVRNESALQSLLEANQNTSNPFKTLEEKISYKGLYAPEELALFKGLKKIDVGGGQWLVQDGAKKISSTVKISSLVKGLAAEVGTKAYPKHTYLWGDIIRGIKIVWDEAVSNQQPLILVLPYQNIFAMDVRYLRWLEALACKPGCCVIVPAGDDGRAQHIRQMVQGDCIKEQLVLTSKAATCLQGQLQTKACRLFDVTLTSPKGQKFSLSVARQICDPQGDMRTTGMQYDPLTGETSIFWQADLKELGTWSLEVEKQEMRSGLVELYLEYAPPYIKPDRNKEVWSQTLTELAASPYFISCGCFKSKEQVPYPFSAYGGPNPFITLSVSDALYGGKTFESTLEAAYLVGQVCKEIYKIRGNQLCTPSIKNSIVPYLSQIEGYTYPSMRLGTGILDKAALKRLFGGEMHYDYE